MKVRAPAASLTRPAVSASVRARAYPYVDEPQSPIGIRVSGANGTAGSYTVTVKRVPFTFETLPLTETTDCGTSRSTACGMNVGDTVGGSIGTSSDTDYRLAAGW